jgi:hypothetical protein
LSDTLNRANGLTSTGFSPDGQRVVTASVDAKAAIYRIVAGGGVERLFAKQKRPKLQGGKGELSVLCRRTAMSHKRQVLRRSARPMKIGLLSVS